MHFCFFFVQNLTKISLQYLFQYSIIKFFDRMIFFLSNIIFSMSLSPWYEESATFFFFSLILSKYSALVKTTQPELTFLLRFISGFVLLILFIKICSNEIAGDGGSTLFWSLFYSNISVSLVSVCRFFSNFLFAIVYCNLIVFLLLSEQEIFIFKTF